MKGVEDYTRFLKLDVEVPRFPPLTAAVAFLGHAAGGVMLLTGRAGTAFLVLTFSMITNILDAYSFSYLSPSIGRRVSPLLVTRDVEEGDGGSRAIFLLDTTARQLKGSTGRNLYLLGFFGGTLLFFISIFHLSGFRELNISAAAGTVISFAALFSLKKPDTAGPALGPLKKAKEISDLLPGGEGFASILVIITEGLPQTIGILNQFRKTYRGSTIIHVSYDDSISGERCMVDLAEGSIIPYRISPSLRETVKVALENEGLRVSERKRGSGLSCLAALARGFNAVPVTFGTGVDAKRVANGIMAIERLKYNRSG